MRTRAFMMVEALVYCAVLVVVLALASTAFYHAWGNFKRLKGNAEDIARTVAAGERWREDVRSGAAVYSFADGVVWREDGGEKRAVLRGVERSVMTLDRRQRVSSWRWEVELRCREKTARVKPLFTFQAVGGEGK